MKWGGFPRDMISGFRFYYFKISDRYLSKWRISVSASIPISEIRQFFQSPISVLRPYGNPLPLQMYIECDLLLIT